MVPLWFSSTFSGCFSSPNHPRILAEIITLGQALNCWFCLLCLPYCFAACNWERLKFVFVNEQKGLCIPGNLKSGNPGIRKSREFGNPGIRKSREFVFVDELNGNRILCTDLLNIAKEYNTLSQFKMLFFLSLKTQLFMNTKYFLKINSEALNTFEVGTRVID